MPRIEKAPGGDQNEENNYLHRIDRSRVCPCNCVEHSEHDLGRHPVRLGLRFLPRLLRVPLCPACRREGLLAVKGIISGAVVSVVVSPLTAFYGLRYIMGDYGVFYPVLIAFTLIAALNLILTARKPATAKA